MGFKVVVLKDSVNVVGCRLVTIEATFPRIILPEVNTHRALSRNSASSRAIPINKIIEKVMTDPFVPSSWGANRKGMQATENISDREAAKAIKVWLKARDSAIKQAQKLQELGVHKQLTNRLLEPFMWHTAIISATEWSNFLNLRDHADAQPEIAVLAGMIRSNLNESVPTCLKRGAWHLPMIDVSEIEGDPARDWIRVSAGRCARVSYLTHDGRRDADEDVKLCNRLISDGHMSPTEHQAQALDNDQIFGNFKGFVQFRKSIPGEAVFIPKPHSA